MLLIPICCQLLLSYGLRMASNDIKVESSIISKELDCVPALIVLLILCSRVVSEDSFIVVALKRKIVRRLYSRLQRML